MDKIAASFSAVNVMPIKVIRNTSLVRQIVYAHKIPPIHLQLNPVNRCNFACSFCSCANEHDDNELDVEMVDTLAYEFAKLGASAITITGGGEPTLHHEFGGIVSLFQRLGYDISLVTNGASLAKVGAKILRALTWCRVSLSDEHTITDIKNGLIDAVSRAPSVAWGMSYVVTAEPRYDGLVEAIHFANDMKMTHLRVVSDILDEDGSPDVSEIKRVVNFLDKDIDDSRVVYQGRKHPTSGRKNCWIGLLKPNITADGFITPCCGVMYARDKPDRCFPKDMMMGHVDNIQHIWKEQKPFDGSQCVRCYYDDYNSLLANMLAEIDHENFV